MFRASWRADIKSGLARRRGAENYLVRGIGSVAENGIWQDRADHAFSHLVRHLDQLAEYEAFQELLRIHCFGHQAEGDGDFLCRPQ